MDNLRLIPLDAHRLASPAAANLINDRQKAGPAAPVDAFVIPHDASAASLVSAVQGGDGPIIVIDLHLPGTPRPHLHDRDNGNSGFVRLFIPNSG